uniref:Uncharacterized protein n=1 Tax=Lactuca sativa TaxID=4236 RepID=A0A9R1UFS1_LACSA|nr:hypothetical protein LSAT_V11C900491730 [Lactuca sativa]
MEGKQERPKLDPPKQALENISKQMSGNFAAQSPRYGSTCTKLLHFGVQDGDGMRRIPSEGKMNCLCSPTTHAGSFRCRLHRTSSNTNNNSSSGGRSFNSLSNLAEILERANMVKCKPLRTPPKIFAKFDGFSYLNDDPTLDHNLSRVLQYLIFTKPNIMIYTSQLLNKYYGTSEAPLILTTICFPLHLAVSLHIEMQTRLAI